MNTTTATPPTHRPAEAANTLGNFTTPALKCVCSRPRRSRRLNRRQASAVPIQAVTPLPSRAGFLPIHRENVRVTTTLPRSRRVRPV